MPSRVEQAAHNNAIWCDTVCRAQGASGEFFDTVWLNRHSAPRFYPNMVTLTGRQAVAAQRAQVMALLDSGLPGQWGVKDSFAALDLADLGFQVAIEATWIWHAPAVRSSYAVSDRIRWTYVQHEAELTLWEAAWNGDPVNTSAGSQDRLFMPALLAEPDIAFMAAYRGEVIIGGAIANRTGSVVGLSNVFGSPADRAAIWAGCIATVEDRFPGLPLVGYQRGPELAVAQSLGFEPLHDLRIWTRQAE